VSGSGKRLFVSNPANKVVYAVEVSSGSSKRIDCGCSPDDLQRLNGDSVFWLKEAGAAFVRILDADAEEPRILMVPIEQTSN
jgi:hypothetical protein